MQRKLNVYFFNKKAGYLSLNEKKQWIFIYDPHWLKSSDAKPISLSLPLQEKAFDSGVAHAFFSNLLPEGDMRERIEKYLGISFQNDFALLDRIGGECAGAISLLAANKKFDLKGAYKPLSSDQIKKLFTDLNNRPFLAGEKNIRLSLAGAQNKLPVCMQNNQLFLPVGQYSSSHILKPPIPRYDATVSNEVFCMKLAKAIGLSVANVAIYHDKITLFCTERFDRYKIKNKIKRLHQEDFCQALGILPSYKYESEGGPNLRQCFQIIKKYSIQPLIDQRELIKWIIYNYLIGNADAHAKNIAILFDDNGPKLAPFYDLFCTSVYSGLTKRLAMKIGGENRPDWIQKRHWETLAKENEFNFKVISHLFLEMVKHIGHKINSIKLEVIEVLPEDKIILEKIEDIINSRIKKLSRLFF